MPIYIFQRESTKEVKEVFQNMNDKHEYFGADGSENDWKRVFTVPNASIDTNVDPFDSKQFVERTGAKKGTIGSLMDQSKELSEKRAEKNGGVDPVKEKYFQNYSKQRNGAKHVEQMKSFENSKVKVDYD